MPRYYTVQNTYDVSVFDSNTGKVVATCPDEAKAQEVISGLRLLAGPHLPLPTTESGRRIQEAIQWMERFDFARAGGSMVRAMEALNSESAAVAALVEASRAAFDKLVHSGLDGNSPLAESLRAALAAVEHNKA